MFRRIEIAQVMAPNPVCVDRDEKLCKANRLMGIHQMGALPVTDSGYLIGSVTEGAVRAGLNHRLSDELTVAEVLNTEVHRVGADERVGQVMHEMAEFGIDVVFVTCDKNRLIGLFTRQNAFEMLLKGPGATRFAQEKEDYPQLKAA